ncbi:MAG: branched-chain amino acid ABC transporter permease [bacterium]|nr:branched-chain amino acid ABC transporter permease [Acidimicrobiia bacterium]MCY4649689.1 branched-chain amino acid ABC transporter permease [bacterium]
MRTLPRRGSRRRVAAGVLLILGILLLEAGPVAGQSSETVGTRLRYQNEEGERIPVEGVMLSVTTVDGSEVGSGVTDADGAFSVPVPQPAVYLVSIDVETLPVGIRLREPDRVNVEVEVGEGRSARAIFSLISGDAPVVESGGITVRRVAQLTTEGIKLGLFLGMAAIGLSLVFGTTGLVNFAHGEMVTWGMLSAYFFNYYGLAGAFGFMAGWWPPLGQGMNLILAAVMAVIIGGASGYCMDRWIFRPLRTRGVSLIAQMVVTIGLSILARYVFLFLFGGNLRFFKDYSAQSAIQIWIVDITPKDLITVVLSVLFLIAVGLFLQRTQTGKAMRAVADNRDLAESSGINVQRVIKIVWIGAGALAGLGGVFIGLAEQLSWLIGFRMLLLIFAGVVLGGLGTAYGALLGCLLVGVGIQLSTLFIPVELKNIGALVVLALVLVLRPQGLLGRRERFG